MAALTRSDVEAIAELARIALEDGEVETLRSELTAILAHMDELSAVDTDGVEPLAHVVPMNLRLRPDQVKASLDVEQVMEQAPAHRDGCFEVPHIIESGNDQ